MFRGSSVLLLVGLVAIAHADDHEDPSPLPSISTSSLTSTSTVIARQFADEALVLERSGATVREKLAGIDHDRSRRLAAAYRILRAPTTLDPVAAARRRAAARWIVSRDQAERTLLADELSKLTAAGKRTAEDAKNAASVVMPTELAWPAKGTIARHFGTLVHEKSKATLARRGIDIEVDSKAAVSSLADGVVRYAGPIRGLDSGLIIDHGSYLTVVAKLGELAVPVGAKVAAGDRLGRAARYRVYVEVRVKVRPGGLPIDPEPLLR